MMVNGHSYANPLSSFPKYRTINWWKEYCLGKKSEVESDSSSEDEGMRSEEESEQSSLNDTPKSEMSLKKPMKGHEPLMSVVCYLKQEEVQRLIEFFIKWMRQFKFTRQMGVWMFALLVLLEKPLPSEVYSTLRELSRLCSEIRERIDWKAQSASTEQSNLQANSSPSSQSLQSNELSSVGLLSNRNLKSLNLIICIIGRYFDQTDMIDQ
jgi:hypothetical protein